MNSYFGIVSASVALATLAWFGARPAPGVELSSAGAASIVGGADCGDTYERKTVNCSDEVYRHNNGDVNCNTASYEAYVSTGTGSREPSSSSRKSCRVCGSFCNSSTGVDSHRPKKCNSP